MVSEPKEGRRLEKAGEKNEKERRKERVQGARLQSLQGKPREGRRSGTLRRGAINRSAARSIPIVYVYG